jgi:hypothetical protein
MKTGRPQGRMFSLSLWERAGVRADELRALHFVAALTLTLSQRGMELSCGKADP